jgi:hypothetical protein
MAAKHEIEVRDSMSNARALLQQAIRINETNQQLWIEVVVFYVQIRLRTRFLIFENATLSCYHCNIILDA